MFFDPITSALIELVGEDGSLSAFADDIGVSVGDIIRALLALVPILGPIGAATCFKLNWKRTHIVNFLSFYFSGSKRRLRRQCHRHLELRFVILLGTRDFLLAPVPRTMHGRPLLLERARHIKDPWSLS